MTIHPDEGMLQAHLDGEAPSELEQLFVGHLRSCEACAARLAELGRMARRTRDAVSRIDESLSGLGAARWAVRREHRARRGRFRLGRGAVAASVVLLAGAGIVAAMPGSPVRGWLSGDTVPSPGSAPIEGAVAPQDDDTAEFSRFMASAPLLAGRIGVSFTGVPDRTLLEVHLLDGESAVTLVRAPAEAAFETANGWIMVRVDGVVGDLEVEIPRSAALADVSVNGSTVFRMDGGRLAYPGPTPLDADGTTVRFRIGNPGDGGTRAPGGG